MIRVLLAGAVLALALAPRAFADTIAGVLGAAASASDYYEVTCSNDGGGAPVAFSVQVRDEPPVAAPIVSVQMRVFRAGMPATYAAWNSTDASDGDGIASPLVSANNGPGKYDVFVDKTAAGEEPYLLAFQCTTAADGGGSPTGTEITAASVILPEPVPVLGFVGQLGLCALLLVGLARGALAHTQSGSLSDAAGATDYYQVTCNNDGAGPPASLSIEVEDTAPVAAPLVSVQARKGTLIANTTDATDGNGTSSPPVHVNGGGGVYDVLVDKTAAGAESYTLDFHCMTGADGAGEHTGTEIVIRQNQ
jgi:hypothetical protein